MAVFWDRYRMSSHPRATGVVEAWSVQRVADTLHVSESTIRRLLLARAFPHAFRVGRKLVRIPVTDVDGYQRRARLRVPGSTDDDLLPFEHTA
jgi:excisionase family DNA binding protein